jgi:hypothetical protein
MSNLELDHYLFLFMWQVNGASQFSTEALLGTFRLGGTCVHQLVATAISKKKLYELFLGKKEAANCPSSWLV